MTNTEDSHLNLPVRIQEQRPTYIPSFDLNVNKEQWNLMMERYGHIHAELSKTVL